MSGLGNVLGNVYGDKDDQPQNPDLTDVQDSMDALVDGAVADEVADAPDGAEEVTDDDDDWVTFEDDDSVIAGDNDDEVFSSDEMTFLDDEDSEQVEPPRADWLSQIPEGDDSSWMDDLAEDPELVSATTETAEVDPPGDLIVEGPTLDDLIAATEAAVPAPTPDPTPLVTSAAEEDVQDEQWLDDLFSPTETASEPGRPQDPSGDTPIADLGSEISPPKTPSWDELQTATADATTTAGEPRLPSPSPPPTADWIRADDDILPVRGRSKRRHDKFEMPNTLSTDDPINMFSPDEEAVPKSRRIKTKRSKGQPALQLPGITGPGAVAEPSKAAELGGAAETGDSAPEAAIEHDIAPPPVITDVGMPDAPGPIGPFVGEDDETPEPAASTKSSRKFFKRN